MSSLLGGCRPPSAAPTFESLCRTPSAAIFDSIHSYVATLRHSNAYVPLTLDQTNAVRAAARALLASDAATAATEAQQAEYAIVPLVAASSCYVVLQPTDHAPVGQGMLIAAGSWKRDLIVEAPHIPNDFRTDEEAALLFPSTEARALILAGADRCGVTDASGCHSNHECNAAGIAVESDPSHSVKSAVHAMHLAAALDSGTSTVLQLHTNVYPTLNGDAQISNGTRYPIPGTAADRLYAAFQPSGFDVRTCNDPSQPPPVGAFCGEVNAQSLASNGSTDPCVGLSAHSGPPSQHRFIQLEQNSDRLVALDSWASGIADAIMAAIPAQ